MNFFPNISVLPNFSSSLSSQLRQVALLTGGDLEIATSQAGLNSPTDQKSDSILSPPMQNMMPAMPNMMTGGVDSFSKQGGLYSALLPYLYQGPAMPMPPAPTTPMPTTPVPMPPMSMPPMTQGASPAPDSTPANPISSLAPDKPPVVTGPVPNESSGTVKTLEVPKTPTFVPSTVAAPIPGSQPPASIPAGLLGLGGLFPGIAGGNTNSPFTLTLPLPLFQQMLFEPASGMQPPGLKPNVKPTADTSGIPSSKESWPRPLAAPDVIAYVEDLVSGTFAKDGLIGKGDLKLAQELATSSQVKSQLKELLDYFGVVERNNPDNLIDAAAIENYYERYPVI